MATNSLKPIIAANTFLYLANTSGADITEQKLQQLVYSLYKQHLKATGEKLFEEPFWKTQRGPELSSIHNAFGKAGLLEYAKDQFGKIEVIDIRIKLPIVHELKAIWNTYKNIPEYRFRSCLMNSKSAWAAAVSTLDDENIKKEPMYLDRNLGLER